MTMRATRAHLRTVGGQPTDFKPFSHAHLGEKLSQQKHSMPAEASDLDAEILEVMVMFSLLCPRRFGLLLRRDLQHVRHCALWWSSGHWDLDLSIAKYIQWERRHHRLRNPLTRFDGVLRPNRRTWRQDFYEREARAVSLQLQCFAHRPPRLHDVLVVAQGHALDVHRSLKRRNDLCHVHREAFVTGAASPRRSRALLPDQRGRRHLAACHAIDRIVNEEHADLLAAIRGMQDFRSPNRCQVAVALI